MVRLLKDQIQLAINAIDFSVSSYQFVYAVSSSLSVCSRAVLCEA